MLSFAHTRVDGNNFLCSLPPQWRSKKVSIATLAKFKGWWGRRRQVLHDILSACCSSLPSKSQFLWNDAQRSVRMRLKTTASQEPVSACTSVHENRCRWICPPTSAVQNRTASPRRSRVVGTSRRNAGRSAVCRVTIPS